ncbi:SpoIIIAH-like family protein [Sporohalobacter salinus]|uniref:SpoIIIAH-like family protein n=1 Tax=Sporohalobacter salinus TaxID=1494606 RepID=UPI001961C568|nr:SpoIIIAH-like family protein [Sporohalobacter salinus]MBM7622756.1 stage III sporulation protein AH [Sporohalobacter salinus]
MSIFIRKKLIWLLVLMLWVGMISAIVVYNVGDSTSISKIEKAAKPKAKQVSSMEVETSEELEEKLKKVEQKAINVAKTNKGNSQEDKNFFVEYRLERDKIRSEQVNLLREMINNPNSNKELKNKAQNRLLEITNNLEKEMEVESLIRARDYKDAISFIHQNSVDVIIASNKGLKRKDVAKIGDIVAKTTGLEMEDVTIIEKKY